MTSLIIISAIDKDEQSQPIRNKHKVPSDGSASFVKLSLVTLIRNR